MNFARALLLPAFLLASGCHTVAADTGAGESEIRVEVPPRVADMATQRSGGNARAAAPVLVLENVELGTNERLSVQVLAPKKAPGGSVVLGSAATVGQPQAQPQAPVQRMTLSIPLNDRALPLLANQREVTLVLRVRNGATRSPLRYERAFFN